jgi:SdrD B-like domain/Secretion system C-terminal sorting domain
MLNIVITKKTFMKTKLLTFFLLLSTYLSFSQTATVNWAKQFGGASISETKFQSTVLDAAGNIYVAGTFVGTADFDPGPGVFNLTSAGTTNSVDAYILKLDPTGNLLWVKQIENESISQSFSIAVDLMGNVYITGMFQYSADFDPGPGVFTLTTGAVPEESYLLKLDKNGNFVWAKHFERDFINLVITDNNGFIYGSGIRNSTISKFGQAGNMLWEKHTSNPASPDNPNTASTINRSFSLDNVGNIYAAGVVGNICDFDPGTGQFILEPDNPYGNGYIWKLDNDGNFIFVKLFQQAYAELSAITIDVSGNILTTGTFNAPVDFDPGNGNFILQSPGTPNLQHAFISKLDNSGNFIWAKPIYGDFTIRGNVIKTDLQGNVYTSGYFTSTYDFDPAAAIYNLTSPGGLPEIFLSKLNTAGNLVWVKKMGGCSYEETFGMAIDAAGSIFITGVAGNTARFDNFIFNEPDNTQFIAKLTQSASLPATVSLGSRVWNDINKNGIDNNEPGMAGLRVNLYRDDNNDNIADGCFTDFTYTDSTGNYSFTHLEPGNYIAGLSLPSGFSNSPVNGGDPDNNIDKDNNGKLIIETFNASSMESELRGFGITLTLNGEPSGSINNTYDFGLVQGQLCLGNRIWKDINKNGKDNGEPGISNVPVVLYKVKSKTDTISVALGLPDGTGPLMQTTTDVNGYYSFKNLFPGYYIVYTYMPEGYVITKKNGGDPDNNIDKDNNGKFVFANFNSTWGLPITLTVNGEPNGNINNTYDFGLRTAGINGGDDDDDDEQNSRITVTAPVVTVNAAVLSDKTDANKKNLIYPNPFVNEIRIQLESTENTKAAVNIVTADGKLIYSANKDLGIGTNQFIISGLEKMVKGVYIVKIQTEKNIISKKLFKE